MKNSIHFLCRTIDPQGGGMEQSIARVAGHLGGMPDTTVQIYTLGDAENSVADLCIKNVRTIPLKDRKDFLARPLERTASTVNRRAEVNHVEFLAYTGAVKAAMDAQPGCRHVVLSFFISQTGFMAQQVADALKIPHIASARGSDFNRDLREPDRLNAIAHVIRRAGWLVAINREHADSIRRIFGRRSGVTTIPNPVALPPATPFWEPARRSPVRLFSDSGYSFKKGTHVLLRAVADLAKEGRPVKLTLTGNVDRDAADYWQAEKQAYAGGFPGTFAFEAWLAPDEIVPAMLQADIYCSASFGEGCSMARMKALALGMPIATTRCGEMPELAAGAGHVRLAEPGDLEGYRSVLREAVAETLDGGIQVRRNLVTKWRRDFRPEIECLAWQKVAGRVLRRGVSR